MDIKKTDNCKSGSHSHCQEIMDNIFRLLDGEMTEVEETAFYDHVNKCSNCLDDYHIEKAFKDFVCKKMNKRTIDPSLIETIKMQIKNMDAAKALLFIATIAKLLTT